MVNVRGVNVYPTAIESVVRGFREITEYRATVCTNGSLRELSLDIELMAGVDGASNVGAQVVAALRDALGLTVPVHVVDAGTLPRFELKARRFVIG
jgi:phenylacetate-CoA ligase